jgi:folate-binding protein YgfZ
MSLPFQHTEPEGTSDPDLIAAQSGSIFAVLGHLGVLAFSGEDAQSFLQGQLSCDVANLGLRSSTYGAYCSPKGRMLANFLLWREETGFFMALARDIVPAVQRNISRFVLRSKVKVSDASAGLVLAGAAGEQADPALRAVFSDFPKKPEEASRQRELGTVIKLKDGRFVLALAPSGASLLRQRVEGFLKPVDARAWRWLDIRSGLPWVSAATQDQLLPQMANLELLGGVSFSKGCYTGQEIVARAQHLGRVKRRMFLANVAAAAAAGDELYSADLGEQASGTVVNSEASPEGGHDLLAVVQSASRDHSTVHLKSPGGPVLRFLPLPYALA